MTTYALDRAAFSCRAALAERIRCLVADGYDVEVAEAGDVLYRVQGIEGANHGGPAYWLRDAVGRAVGTVADVGTLVRYAAALPRPVAGKPRRTG